MSRGRFVGAVLKPEEEMPQFVNAGRRKIELDPNHPSHIRTAQGDGYCLVL